MKMKFNPIIEGTEINIFHPPFELIVGITIAIFAVSGITWGLPLL